MRSPFPGVDPYVEAQGLWPGFHHSVLSYYRDALNEHLPDAYVALLGAEMRLVHESAGYLERPQPEVAVARDPALAGDERRVTEVVATLTPITIPLVEGVVEEVRETWIEIRKLPELSLVSVLELLSPTNKVGTGRVEYLEKRDEYIEKPVHIIEVDLLIAGHRLPMKRALPRGEFHAVVSRAERRPDAEVYSWTLRDPLPAIPIPLSAPDADVLLELAPACAMAYDRGRYSRLLRYREPLDLPLAPADRAWAEALARGGPP
jgi:hypothetical protein